MQLLLFHVSGGTGPAESPSLAKSADRRPGTLKWPPSETVSLLSRVRTFSPQPPPMNRLLHPLRLLAPLALLAVVAACDRGPSGLPTAAPGDLPGDARFLRAAEPIPGRYIVVFNDDEAGSAASLAGEMVPANAGKVHYTYDHALKGFAADLTPAAVQALLAHPREIGRASCRERVLVAVCARVRDEAS